MSAPYLQAPIDPGLIEDAPATPATPTPRSRWTRRFAAGPVKVGSKEHLEAIQAGHRESRAEGWIRPTAIVRNTLKPSATEQIIDYVIANPGVSRKQIAQEFKRSDNWVLALMGSDSFQAQLDARKDEIIDPLLRQTIEEQFGTMARLSSEIITEKLLKQRDSDLALQALSLSSKALGYGAQPKAQTNVSFVVQMPPAVKDVSAWEATYSGAGGGDHMQSGDSRGVNMQSDTTSE